MSVTPFVVGQWVRGKKFYGRADLIEEILQGNRNWLWLLGTRRIGKTSLLKQVEHIASRAPDPAYFPVFWDFQGADDPEELHLGFGDSLLDAEDRLQALGISLDEVEDDSLFKSLGRLRRRLRAKKKKLLLLCDEVEELIKLNQNDPSLLRKLRRSLQSQEDIRSVLASTVRLWALSDEKGDTSPFLHGFTPPLYIHNLADDEAHALICQANLPDDSRPRFDDDVIESIRSKCDNHPYLIQLLCKRCLELGDLDEAVEQVATDPMVSFFFSVDFEMLSQTEHDIIRIISERDLSTSESIQDTLSMQSSQLGGSLHRLEHLGYIRRDLERRFVLANYFFRRWLCELSGTWKKAKPAGSDAAAGPASTQSTVTYEVQLGSFDGRYELLERIGRGAMGEVFKARDTILRADIAIKLLRHEYSSNEEALERLRREIILSRDISHPNVVSVYHLGEFQGKKYLTMKWVDGPSLGKVISEQGPLSAERVVGIALKMADALNAAHQCSVLHRDFKPQNILLDENDEPFLTDFGLARLVQDPGMTRDGVFLGTPNYAAPEQAGMRGVDERSDLYSLGVVMFEMVTGQKPFNAATTAEILAMHREAAPPTPRDVHPAVPIDLSNLIFRCLAKDPADRCQSAGELRRALEECDLENADQGRYDEETRI